MKCRHSGLGLPPLAGLLLAQLVSAALLPYAWQITSYDAGTHGNPAVAPSPVTQGWTETTGAGTSVGGDPLQMHDVWTAR